MPQVGWRDPANGREESFDYWLADAAKNGEALGLPYEVLLGIKKQLDKSDRPDGFSATMLSKCARAIWLDQEAEYYAEPTTNYDAFRGTIGHTILEKNQHPGAVVERRIFRMYRGQVLSGQLDKLRVIVPDWTPEQERELLDQWLRYCDDLFAVEMAEAAGLEVSYDEYATTPPELPEGARFLIEDWKTKDKVPFGIYVYDQHKKQGNIYRWLLRIPKDLADIRFIYVSMAEVKSLSVYNGGKFANGRERPVQVWTDEEVAEFLDERLRPLALQKKLGRPLPYAKVPTEDLWECDYCPVRELCYREAAKEARAEWEKGNDIARIPPRSQADEQKVSLPKRKNESNASESENKPKRTRKKAAEPLNTKGKDELPF